MARCALTTIDNPYDPFTQFDAWFQFDEGKGYHSCAYLARIARTSDQLSGAENEQEIERAMLYRTLKRMIERGQTEGIEKRLDVFYAAGKLTDDEYSELIGMLK